MGLWVENQARTYVATIDTDLRIHRSSQSEFLATDHDSYRIFPRSTVTPVSSEQFSVTVAYENQVLTVGGRNTVETNVVVKNTGSRSAQLAPYAPTCRCHGKVKLSKGTNLPPGESVSIPVIVEMESSDAVIYSTSLAVSEQAEEGKVPGTTTIVPLVFLAVRDAPCRAVEGQQIED